MEITRQDALDCFASDDLIGIGMEADAVRRALHLENVVTYTVPITLALDQPLADLLAAVEACARDGDTTVCLNPSLGSSLDEIEVALAAIRQRCPAIHLRALRTIDILALADSSALRVDQTLDRVHTAGLDSISGDDLCVVCARPSHGSSGLASLDRWIEVHRHAHQIGLTSTAGLFFGIGEASEDRVNSFFAIRALQAETNGFTAFTLLSPTPSTYIEPPTAVEYLRTLAIARIALDNVLSIESSCVAQGLKVVQMALRFGANDAGSIASPNATKSIFTEEDLRRVIRDAGFTPIERDPLYRTLYLNN